MENDVKIADKINIMRTTRKRKIYKPEFKAKVALEAVKGRLTLNQIAREFEVHPNQVSTWKKQFLESVSQIFESLGKSKSIENEELTNQLYQQIGQMKVELDWLKKKSVRLG